MTKLQFARREKLRQFILDNIEKFNMSTFFEYAGEKRCRYSDPLTKADFVPGSKACIAGMAHLLWPKKATDEVWFRFGPVHLENLYRFIGGKPNKEEYSIQNVVPLFFRFSWPENLRKKYARACNSKKHGPLLMKKVVNEVFDHFLPPPPHNPKG